MDKFKSIGVIKNEPEYDNNKLENFEFVIEQLKLKKSWNKKEIVREFFKILPGFRYLDRGKYLDGKM